MISLKDRMDGCSVLFRCIYLFRSFVPMLLSHNFQMLVQYDTVKCISSTIVLIYTILGYTAYWDVGTKSVVFELYAFDSICGWSRNYIPTTQTKFTNNDLVLNFSRKIFLKNEIKNSLYNY